MNSRNPHIQHLENILTEKKLYIVSSKHVYTNVSAYCEMRKRKMKCIKSETCVVEFSITFQFTLQVQEQYFDIL